jgi:hypothetical protein
LVELWLRHWSCLDRTGAYYVDLDANNGDEPQKELGPIWLCTDALNGLVVDGKPYVVEPDNVLDDGRRVFVMPIPLRAATGMKVRTARRSAHLVFDRIPDRPLESSTNDQPEAKILLDRVKSVWARLREVETAIADPALIWERLCELWLNPSVVADP